MVFGGVAIADSRRTKRVLETGHPPVYYIPPEDVQLNFLVPSERRTVCEHKGVAHYFAAVVGEAMAEDAGWFYPDPRAGFEEIGDHIAFYADKMDACLLDGERVRFRSGDYYGGWITTDLEGLESDVTDAKG